MSDTTLNFTYLGPNGVRLEMRHVSGLGGGAVTLSATDINSVIGQLAKFREQMTPEIARTFPVGEHHGVVDPLWEVKPIIDQKTLFLRHHGLGWISFLFPPQEAKKLGNALLSEPQNFDPQIRTDRPH